MTQNKQEIERLTQNKITASAVKLDRYLKLAKQRHKRAKKLLKILPEGTLVCHELP